MNGMTLAQVASQLQSIIADVKGIDADSIVLSPDDDFLVKYDLGSMDAVSLSVKISQQFGFGFGESIEDVDSLISFGALAKRIHAVIANPAHAC